MPSPRTNTESILARIDPVGSENPVSFFTAPDSSHRVGDQLRVLTNREYLARALNLGFHEIGFVDSKSPCVCQDSTRTKLLEIVLALGSPSCLARLLQ